MTIELRISPVPVYKLVIPTTAEVGPVGFYNLFCRVRRMVMVSHNFGSINIFLQASIFNTALNGINIYRSQPHPGFNCYGRLSCGPLMFSIFNFPWHHINFKRYLKQKYMTNKDIYHILTQDMFNFAYVINLFTLFTSVVCYCQNG